MIIDLKADSVELIVNRRHASEEAAVVALSPFFFANSEADDLQSIRL